jgi:long-chain acyl-CoA synthetase
MTIARADHQPENLVDLWEESAARHAGNPVFGTKRPDHTFGWVTYPQVGRRIDDLRAGLAALGVQPGDAVGLVANNRVEWAVAAFATYGRRARFVPMYEAELPAVWAYIVRDAGVKVLLVSTPAVRDRVREAVQGVPGLALVVIEGDGEDSLAALERRGRAAPVPSQKPQPDDVASLIYTSGTTGEPKGVLLSHRNFISNVKGGQHMFPELATESCSLSILPWAHAYGQTAELYNFIDLGAAIGIAASRDSIVEDIRLVRPTYLIGVPRIFNRIHDGIWSQVRKAGGVKLKLFTAALEAARDHREHGGLGITARLLDRLVLAKIRERFGGRLVGALSGSARMNVEVAKFFFDLGMPVYDCYGTTETSPAVTMNSRSACKLGTVGRPIEKVRVVIDRSRVDDGGDDGEIVVYGPNVMLGYHNKPEATAAVMTADGGLRTGDRGRIDEDGYLLVTGRFKEQYKLENGKYVFPAAIEEELQLVPWVVNSMVHGDGRPHNVCLVVLDLAFLRERAAKLGLGVEPGELLDDSSALGRAEREVIALELVRHLEGKFGNYEIPRQFVFIAEPFTVENGLLTQTLKLKRKPVLERYGASLQALYDSKYAAKPK